MPSRAGIPPLAQLRPGRVWVGRVFWVGDRPWKSPRAPVVPQGMDPSMAPTPVPPKRNESTTGAPKQAMKVWEPQNMSCFGVNVRKTLGPGVCRATIAYGFIGSLLRWLLGGGLVGNVEETPSANAVTSPVRPVRQLKLLTWQDEHPRACFFEQTKDHESWSSSLFVEPSRTPDVLCFERN